MQFLALLIAIVGATAIGYWRFRIVQEVVSAIADAAGRTVDKYRRSRFHRKPESSTLAAVEDPITAAAIMMVSVAEEDGPLRPEAEAALRAELAKIGRGDPTEMIVFARWVVRQVADSNTISTGYSKIWTDCLDIGERRDLVAMVRNVALANGGLTRRQNAAIRKLAGRLEL